MHTITRLIATSTLSSCLAAGALADTAPFPIAGGGDTYVFTAIGPWSNEHCHHSNSVDLELADLLQGATDEASCLLDDARFADASAEVGFLLDEDGFTAAFGGQGHAEGAETFNRHDVNTDLELGFSVDTRLRVDWTMEAGGLGSAGFQMRRLGDIGGELDVSPAVIDRSISSYIEPLSEQGQDVVFIPAGRWNLRMISNHQASGDWEEGFQQSWSECTHIATIVALGDVDGDGVVGVADLLEVIAHWGVVEADDADARLADLDGNDTIDVDDLLRVISDWG